MAIVEYYNVFLGYHLGSKRDFSDGSYPKAKEIKEILEKKGYKVFLREPDNSTKPFDDTPSIAKRCDCFLLIVDRNILQKCDDIINTIDRSTIKELRSDSWIVEEIKGFLIKFDSKPSKARGYIQCFCYDDKLQDKQVNDLHSVFTSMTVCRKSEEVLRWVEQIVSDIQQTPTQRAVNEETAAIIQEELKEDLSKDIDNSKSQDSYMSVKEFSKLFKYRTIGNGIVITKYIGSGIDVVIPNAVIKSSKKVPIVAIDQKTFYNCRRLTSIVIPNGVTSIGNLAFHGCSSLTSIEIPDSVTSIGNLAFHGCSSLTSIVIPNSVTSIDIWAFRDCSRLKIYCEAERKPKGWSRAWNYDRPVVWGYKDKA